MGIMGNLYTGSAALGKVQSYVMLCCCALIACFFSAYGASYALKDDPKYSKKTASIAGISLSLFGCCMLLSGLMCFATVQQHKGVAALWGAGTVMGWGADFH